MTESRSIDSREGLDAICDVGGLSALFSGMRDAVIVADCQRRIVWVNHAAEEIFGYSGAELIGRGTALLYAEIDEYYDQGKVRFNRNSVPDERRYTVRYRRRSGETFPGETSGTAIRDKCGSVRGYLGIVHDVSTDAAFEETLRALYAVSSDHTLSSATKIERILLLGRNHFRLPTAIVSLIEDQDYTVLHALSSEADLDRGAVFKLGDTYCTHTLMTAGPTAFHEVAASEIAMHPCYKAFGLEAYIGIPLIVDGERFGTLNFSGSMPRGPFTPLDLELIKLFAAWVAQELSRAKAMELLKRQARTDSLTGCLSRAAFLAKVDAVLDNGTDTATLVIFDLDHFKSVNDTYGHAAGDAVLIAVVRTWEKLRSRNDAIGRLGGEEFAILCPGSDEDATFATADAFRAAIEAAKIEAGQHKIRVTASFGLAELSPDYPTSREWLERADRALYSAKRAGRNRCMRPIQARRHAAA